MIEVLKEWSASILPWVLLDEDTPKKAKLAAIELLDVVDNRELYGYLDVAVEKEKDDDVRSAAAKLRKNG